VGSERWLFFAGWVEAIGETNQWFVAEGEVIRRRGDGGAVGGIDCWTLVEQTPVPSVDGNVFTKGELHGAADDTSGAEGVADRKRSLLGVRGEEGEEAGSGFDGGRDAAMVGALDNVGS